MRKRGRPQKIDSDQVKRDILRFLDPVKSIDLKLGYPTKRVHEYVNRFYKREYSRRTIFRCLMELWKQGFLTMVEKYHRYYWKGKHLRYNYEYDVARFKDVSMSEGEYSLDFQRRVKEFKRLGFDPLNPLSSLKQNIPYRATVIVHYSPQELPITYKQEIVKKKLKKERKSTKKN